MGRDHTPGPWRIQELAALGARAVAAGEVEPGESRRVRWRPNPRLLRYYTTLGLLDRPAEIRGRTAYYGERHLLQLLAVKSLQGRGLSLEEIQRRLTGLPDRDLRRVAALPDDWTAAALAEEDEEGADDATEPTPASAPASRSRRRSAFWAGAPAAPAPDASPPAPGLADRSPLQPVAHGLALGPGATLLLSPELAGALDPHALAEAAAPLIELLNDTSGGPARPNPGSPRPTSRDDEPPAPGSGEETS